MYCGNDQRQGKGVSVSPSVEFCGRGGVVRCGGKAEWDGMGCSRYKVATVDGEGALDDVGLELAVDVDGALRDGRVVRGREGDA